MAIKKDQQLNIGTMYVTEFYYRKEVRGANILAGVRECKKPERTKLWKQLILMLDQELIFSCEWARDERDEEEMMKRMRQAANRIKLNL
jgi:hypothetical protein